MSGQNPPQEVRMALLSVWFRPQATTRHLMTHGTWAGALVLFAVYFALSWVVTANLTNAKLHWFAFAVLGFAAGPYVLLIEALFMKATGKLFFGKASLRALSTAIAWASVPSCAAALLYIAGLTFFQPGFLRFTERFDESLGAFASGRTIDASFSIGTGEWPYALIGGLAILFSLWGIWAGIRTVGAAQGFGWNRSLFNVLFAYGFAFLIALGVRLFLWEPFSIVSGSMAPTLQSGDYVFANKMSYGYGRYSLPLKMVKEGRWWGVRPSRGDVVVFHTRLNVNFVSRVIGLPGDEIQVRNGVLHINALPVKTTFLREEMFPDHSQNRSVRVHKETLPNGVSYEIYDLMPNSDGDNTPVFNVPGGHYFVMGDNRDNAVDSRFSQVGNVPYEDLVAKVGVIYFSAREPKPESIANAFSNIAWGRIFRRP